MIAVVSNLAVLKLECSSQYFIFISSRVDDCKALLAFPKRPFHWGGASLGSGCGYSPYMDRPLGPASSLLATSLFALFLFFNYY